MEITEIRVTNLRKLIGAPEERGAVAQFAREHNLDPTYIRQLLSGHRSMGEKAARKLEEATRSPIGTLDLPLEADRKRIIQDKFDRLSPDKQKLIEDLINSYFPPNTPNP